jgi:hypothetical protein
MDIHEIIVDYLFFAAIARVWISISNKWWIFKKEN